MSDLRNDPASPNVKPTPAQWVHMFLSASDEQRLEWAERVLQNSDAAAECFITNHAGELRHLRAERDALAATVTRVRALIPDWQANGNSRELEDPTDRVWFECARQLLAVLERMTAAREAARAEEADR